MLQSRFERKHHVTQSYFRRSNSEQEGLLILSNDDQKITINWNRVTGYRAEVYNNKTHNRYHSKALNLNNLFDKLDKQL